MGPIWVDIANRIDSEGLRRVAADLRCVPRFPQTLRREDNESNDGLVVMRRSGN